MNAAYVELARAHAPLLVIALPLLGAALMLVSGPARLCWLVGCIVAFASAAVAIDFVARVLSGAPHAIAATGVSLYADGVGVFGAAIVATLGALIVISAGAFLRDPGARAAPLGLALLFCVMAGWSGALMARDLIGAFVATEIAWLAGIGLTALYAARDRAALNGALRMLSAGGVAAAVMLLGIGMLWRAVGSVNLDALPLAHIDAPNLAGAGVVLIVLALVVKAAIAPFHAWAGAAVGRGGPLVGLGVGALGVLGALCVITRFAGYAITAPEIGAGVSAALGALGGVSVVIGAVQAVGASNVARLAAYACVSQAGCILLSIALGSPAGFAATLVQLLAFAAAALAFYGGAASGRVQALSMLDGYGQRAPLASAAMTAGALSLMGAPLTLGFLGRWRLVEAGVGAGWWWASVLVIVASLAGVFFGGRLIERIYFRRASEQFAGETGAWRLALAPALLAAIVTIAVGFAPSLLLRWAAAAASMLTGIAA
jgi:multicomponent Na+:H+ antiporter subunit D